jgi:hypothetical protein
VTTKWRRRRLDRRGRPRKANARHRATTVAGRAPPPDYGTPELRQRKVRATTRDNLEVNAVGVLYGRGLIDAEEYDTLGTIVIWLHRLASGWADTGGVHGLWSSIIGAATPTPGYIRAVNAVASGLADGARRQLLWALKELDGSRDIVISLAEDRVPPLVMHVLEGRFSDEDVADLARLRIGLDRIGGRKGGRQTA